MDIPSVPHSVEPLEHGRNGEVVNLNWFDHPFLRRLGINVELIPNTVLDDGSVPSFMVEHFAVVLNLNGPERVDPKEVSKYCIFFVVSLRNISPNMACSQ